MALETAHSAELDKASFTRFTAVQIKLTSQTINLLDGSGFLSFPVSGATTTFNGSDPIFGTLANTGTITEATANSSPRLDITLLPATAEALGYLSQPSVQGCRVMVWEGALNPMTGLVIGSPALLWSGRIDVPEITAGPGSRMVRLDTVSAYERFFSSTDSDALNVTWATYMFGAGQTGLAGNVASLQDPPWGQEGQRSTSSGYSTSTQTGGGMFSGGGSYNEMLNLF